jgi:CheY-like chemotaxis protein
MPRLFRSATCAVALASLLLGACGTVRYTLDDGRKVNETLLANLRALGHDLPVWGFTAHAQPRERELCLAAGMNDCLFKPIGLARLRAALATLGPAP